MFPRRKSGVYDRVIKSIVRVREQGERPRTDIMSLDDFVCDLCNAVVGRSRIIQCSYCGRWVCREGCWDTEHLACISCASKIRLCLTGTRIDAETSHAEKSVRKKRRAGPAASGSPLKKLAKNGGKAR